MIALGAFFVLPNYPSTTKWLTEEERALAIARVSSGTGQEDADVSHKSAFIASVKDPKTWGFLITYNMVSADWTPVPVRGSSH